MNTGLLYISQRLCLLSLCAAAACACCHWATLPWYLHKYESFSPVGYDHLLLLSMFQLLRETTVMLVLCCCVAS
jgi:hypothetical protein